MVEPDLSLAGLKLWVHEKLEDDWLNVTARCRASSASVEASGSIIRLSEIRHFLSECVQLDKTLTGTASLHCVEPYLSLTITMKSLGNCELKVFITPDYTNQEHTFIFDIDQSFLPELIISLKRLLQ